MTRTNTSRTLAVTPRMEEAWQAVNACFGRFCLTPGIEALQAMMRATFGRQTLIQRCQKFEEVSGNDIKKLPKPSKPMRVVK